MDNWMRGVVEIGRLKMERRECKQVEQNGLFPLLSRPPRREVQNIHYIGDFYIELTLALGQL